MTKTELRRIYKQKRKQLTSKEMVKFTDLILINFQKLELPFVDCIHTYIAIEELNESNTEYITRYLQFINPEVKICVPKINKETGELKHIIFDTETEFALNNFGIAEPTNGEEVDPQIIDVALTPLLAFDLKGYRVGYGKGFYDKFFQQCRSDIIKIGISFFEVEDTIDDINQFDIPLNYCVTPQTIYSFKQSAKNA